MRVDAAYKATKCAAPDEHGEPGSLRDRNPHGQSVRPLPRGTVCARGPHDSEGSGKGQYAGPNRGLDGFSGEASSIEAIEAAPARIGIGQMEGQCAQVALGGDEFAVAEHVLRRDRFTLNPGVARE